MPSPNVSVEVLRTIHRIQRQLADLKERLDRGPRQRRAADSNVKHREELLSQVQAEVKAMRVAANQKQLQLKAGEDKVKDLKRKLNAAESNREYQVLRDQIAGDEMTNSVLADEILEALEQIDAFQPKVAEAQQGLQAARDKVAAVGSEIGTQEPLLRGDLERLEAELKQQEAALPPEIIDVYRRMVRQLGEEALAPIEGEFCGGCNHQVPVNLLAEVMMLHPAFCKACGRLLYLPEGHTTRMSAQAEQE